jgi:hypothetical protein
MATAVEMQPTQHGVRGRRWPRPSSVLAMAHHSDSTLVDTPPAPPAAPAHVIANTVAYPPPRRNVEHASTLAAGAIMEIGTYSEEPQEMEGSAI